jgi:hypothetical protein
VTSGAAVRQTRTQGTIGVEVADSILRPGSQTLLCGELPLKELAPATDRAERVALDEIQRRAGGHEVAASRPFLLPQGLVDPLPGVVRGLRLVGELRLREGADQEERDHQ